MMNAVSVRECMLGRVKTPFISAKCFGRWAGWARMPASARVARRHIWTARTACDRAPATCSAEAAVAKTRSIAIGRDIAQAITRISRESAEVPPK